MNNLQYILNEVTAEVEKPLQRSGIYYRIFARQKSDDSINKKIKEKLDSYKANGKKMQDLFGIRVIVYFREDVELLHDYYKNNFPGYLETSDTNEDIVKAESKLPDLGALRDKVFMPTRLNLVIRMDEYHSKNLREGLTGSDICSELIDNTYELQLRSVLSEGWHEVEHDLRYKTRAEKWWQECEVEQRMLNGIYATLETSERAMEQIFSSIAYKNYKSSDWTAMIRNHFKIHLSGHLNDDLLQLFTANKKFSKMIFRFEREKLLYKLLNLKTSFPLTMDNVVFLVNRMSEGIDEEIKKTVMDLEPGPIKNDLDTIMTPVYVQ